MVRRSLLRKTIRVSRSTGNILTERKENQVYFEKDSRFEPAIFLDQAGSGIENMSHMVDS